MCTPRARGRGASGVQRCSGGRPGARGGREGDWGRPRGSPPDQTWRAQNPAGEAAPAAQASKLWSRGEAAGPQLVGPVGGKGESPPHELLVSAGSAWGPPGPAGRRGAQGRGSAANPLVGGPEGGGQGASGGTTLGLLAPRTHSKRKRGPSGARSWSARRCPRGGGLGSPQGRAPALAKIQAPGPRPRPSASSRAPPASPSPGRRSACARSAAR